MEKIESNQNNSIGDTRDSRQGSKKNFWATLGIVIFVVALILAGYLWLTGKKSSPQGQGDEESKEGVNQVLEESVKGTLPSLSNNPLESKPNLNPTEKTNPIKEVKTNPFEK